jgi:hypothetical protein
MPAVPTNVITGSHSAAITLTSPAYASPVTVAATASIVPTAGTNAIYAGSAWSVVNDGTLLRTSGTDIYLASGGYVGNSGAILQTGTAEGYGVKITGAQGSVVNSGTIEGSGRFGAGVDLVLGGSVTNLAGGTITGDGDAVYQKGGTLLNAGSIIDPLGMASGYAAFIAGYDNLVAMAPGAVFVGVVRGGNSPHDGSTLALGTGAGVGTATGLGSQFLYFTEVVVDAGASWSLTGGNTVVVNQTFTDSGTLTNAGYLGVGSGGISLAGGASFSNSGTLAGGGEHGFEVYGLYGEGGPATVRNSGTIVVGNSLQQGVYLAAGGLMSNAGTIDVTSPGLGIGVDVKSASGTIVNTGLIESSANDDHGTYLRFGASFTNGAAGTVSSPSAVVGYEGATIVNAGTIIDPLGTTGGFAVNLGYGNYHLGTNLVVDEPGAVFTGLVDGGRSGALAGASTLELASGTQAGSIGGLGQTAGFVHFGNITIDPGAAWSVTGANSVPNYDTLRDSGTLSNAGSLGARVTLAGGGLTNQAGATIAATLNVNGAVNADTVYALTGATILNQGAIYGSRHGIYLRAGGTVTNASGGSITGGLLGVGVYNGAATIINAGTIAALGTVKPAVGLRAGYANRLVVDPGAVFVGGADGGNTQGATIASTLELAAGTTVGSIAYVGYARGFTNFSSVIVDAGASWTMGGADAIGMYQTLNVDGTLALSSNLGSAGDIVVEAGATLALIGNEGLFATISQLAPLGTIEIPGKVETGSAFGGGIFGHYLTLTGGEFLELNFGSRTNAPIVTTDGTNTFITACFASGTTILGGGGAVAVERLLPGDRVVTASGRLAQVRWIGHRRTDLARHPRPWDVMPVRIAAGAFAAGVPARDLVLSPDHAVFVGGALIPVRYLLNGDTIAQETREAVTYWHVELDRHDVLLAEGLACESYLDTGNRQAFDNVPATALHPDFAARAGDAGCARLLLDTAEPDLVAVRAALLARAAPLTFDAGIALDVGGQLVLPRRRGGRLVFTLPSGVAADEAVLVSRSHVPAHVRADSDDTRVLGVAVAAIWRDGRPVPDSDLETGWYQPEPGHRWTDGRGVIPLLGARTVSLLPGPPGRYRVVAAHGRPRAPGLARAGILG